LGTANFFTWRRSKVCTLVSKNHSDLTVTICSQVLAFPLNKTLHMCLPINSPPTIVFWLLPVIVFELLLFVLAAVECGRHIRNLIRAGQWNHQSLFALILRDSVIYFFMCVPSPFYHRCVPNLKPVWISAFVMYGATLGATLAGSVSCLSELPSFLCSFIYPRVRSSDLNACIFTTVRRRYPARNHAPWTRYDQHAPHTQPPRVGRSRSERDGSGVGACWQQREAQVSAAALGVCADRHGRFGDGC
jgi:hypothetical protein